MKDHQKQLAVLYMMLEHPLSSSDGIFKLFYDEFKDVEGFAQIKSSFGDRSIYIPGSREDRVLLVGHADTVWQHLFFERYSIKTPILPRLVQHGNTIYSGHSTFGIGADDRAGVAMLWLMPDLGHSILLTDNEEIGMLGSSKFATSHLMQDVQKTHSFIVSFDRKGSNDFKCYNVGTDPFRQYLTEQLPGFSEPDRKSFTDICVLSKDICGVNLSCGYENEHTQAEHVDIGVWTRNFNIFSSWLSKPLPRFERFQHE